MKRATVYVLLLLFLCGSCTRMDLSDGVKVVRPVMFDTDHRLPVSDALAGLGISLSSGATVFAYSATALGATLTHAFLDDVAIRWFLNGELKAGESSPTIDLGVLQSGFYELAAEIRHGNHVYGARLNFEIQ